MSLMVTLGLAFTLGCDNDATTYSGVVYITTTSGGHVVKVPVTIDPSNKTAPISTGTISDVQLSTGLGAENQTHNYHDVRLDPATDILYYSAIKVDSTGGESDGDVHLGYVDLSDDSVHDATLDATEEAQAGLVYCGTGLTDEYFIPIYDESSGLHRCDSPLRHCRRRCAFEYRYRKKDHGR